MTVSRDDLDSITLERELDLEFEELIPDTLRAPPMDYPEAPPPLAEATLSR